MIKVNESSAKNRIKPSGQVVAEWEMLSSDNERWKFVAENKDAITVVMLGGETRIVVDEQYGGYISPMQAFDENVEPSKGVLALFDAFGISADMLS